jgi:hypothetical protein
VAIVELTCVCSASSFVNLSHCFLPCRRLQIKVDPSRPPQKFSFSNAAKQLCKRLPVSNCQLYTSPTTPGTLKSNNFKKGTYKQPQSWRCEHNLRTPTSRHLPRGPAIFSLKAPALTWAPPELQSRGLLYPHKLLRAYGHWRKRELLQYLRGRVARCDPHRQNHHRRHPHCRPVNNRVSLDAPGLIWLVPSVAGKPGPQAELPADL